MKLTRRGGDLRTDEVLFSPSGVWLASAEKVAALVLSPAGVGKLYPVGGSDWSFPRIKRGAGQMDIWWREL